MVLIFSKCSRLDFLSALAQASLKAASAMFWTSCGLISPHENKLTSNSASAESPGSAFSRSRAANLWRMPPFGVPLLDLPRFPIVLKQRVFLSNAMCKGIYIKIVFFDVFSNISFKHLARVRFWNKPCLSRTRWFFFGKTPPPSKQSPWTQLDKSERPSWKVYLWSCKLPLRDSYLERLLPWEILAWYIKNRIAWK